MFFATFLKYEINVKLKVKIKTKTVWNPKTKGRKLIQVFPSRWFMEDILYEEKMLNIPIFGPNLVIMYVSNNYHLDAF